MLKTLTVLWNGMKMAGGELKANKLRTFLSLLGITFGIFCIIGVLATVDSLKRKVQGDIKKVGSNCIYIDKWEYSGGDNYPWWKYINRPVPKLRELAQIKERSRLSGNASFLCRQIGLVSYKDNLLNNVSIFGCTEDFSKIQSLEADMGRFLSEREFTDGTPSMVIGNETATQLFGEARRALGKQVSMNGKKVTVVGILTKQGQSFANIFDFDNAAILPLKYFSSVFSLDNSEPSILVQGKKKIPTKALQDELEGVMRQVRRLGPAKTDNFSLNDISAFAENTESLFASINLGGWAIAGLSLVVGAFGVANIMFVSVRERTSQIGLKKAVGATRSNILLEFLIESATLCILGGSMGLGLVWLLAQGLATVLPFPIYIAPNIIVLALFICILLGILSGIIPASIAAKMDPVVAIRSK